MSTRLGARPWLAETREAYARLLARSPDPSERRRAGELEAAARATRTELEASAR